MFRSKEDIHMANLKKKTRKRTRKFEIDGVVVTTTTSKVSVLTFIFDITWSYNICHVFCSPWESRSNQFPIIIIKKTWLCHRWYGVMMRAGGRGTTTRFASRSCARSRCCRNRSRNSSRTSTPRSCSSGSNRTRGMLLNVTTMSMNVDGKRWTCQLGKYHNSAMKNLCTTGIL